MNQEAHPFDHAMPTTAHAFPVGAHVRVFNGYREDGYPRLEGWAVVVSPVPELDDTYIVCFDADKGTTGRRGTPAYTRTVYPGMQSEPIPAVFHAPSCRRSLRTIGKAGACAILATLFSLPAFGAEPCKVNVNAATPAELQLFARTGPVLAGRLASGRPYKALNDVDAVKGIGEAWLAVNGPHVAFSGPTTCTEKVPSPRVPKIAAQAPKL